MGSAHPNLVPYRAFEANDGWFVIGVGSDTQWANLCALLNIENKENGRPMLAELPSEKLLNQCCRNCCRVF